MRVYVDFFYENEIIKNLYKNNPYVLCINYNDLNRSQTGTIYLIDNKKVDFDSMGIKFITVDLDEEFLDFYIRNIRNPKFNDLDLRACWFLNRLEPEDQQYYIKYIRDTKFIFSKKQLCEFYTVLNNIDRNVSLSCNNDAFLKKEIDNKYYCVRHIEIT